MSTGITGLSGQDAANAASNNALRDLAIGDFLTLMITELQNQDPLDPMSNTEILQQISEIRNVAATTELTETLDSVQLGQSLATASGLMGGRIKGLTDKGDDVEGLVDRVAVVEGKARLHVGQQEVGINNVREIL